MDETRSPAEAPAGPEVRRVVDAADEAGGGSLAPRAPVAPEALRDLAIAFRTNAEAIQGVKELQAELVRAVKRQDRSEMVLQSTQALNDTFRNLTQVQRELVKRLADAPPPGPAAAGGGSGRLVPLMLIALLVVFLGGTYVVLLAMEQVRKHQQDPALVAKQAAESALVGMRQGLEDRDAMHLREIQRLQEQAESLRQRESALIERLERDGANTADLAVQVRSLEAEKEALASQVLQAQNEILAKRALEQELTSTASRMAVIEPRMEELTRTLDAERAENEHLRKRLAAIGYGLPDPDGQTPTVEEPELSIPIPPAPEDPIDVPTTSGVQRIDRDPMLLTKVRDRMNQMLETSVRPGQGMWQITKIGGVSPDRLIGVMAMRYQKGSGKLIEQLAADELEIWVDRNARSTEFKFIDGSVNSPAGTKRFPGGVLVQRVASGEMTRLWSQSGLLFVRFR